MSNDSFIVNKLFLLYNSKKQATVHQRGNDMTLKEIAKEANVSVSTVSRVINHTNTKAASPEVQARIWEIVRRTGYSPNTAARNLKLGNLPETADTAPKSIACIYARAHTDSSDPFFSSIAKAIELEKPIFHSLFLHRRRSCQARGCPAIDTAARRRHCHIRTLQQRDIKFYF